MKIALGVFLVLFAWVTLRHSGQRSKSAKLCSIPVTVFILRDLYCSSKQYTEIIRDLKEIYEPFTYFWLKTKKYRFFPIPCFSV